MANSEGPVLLWLNGLNGLDVDTADNLREYISRRLVTPLNVTCAA